MNHVFYNATNMARVGVWGVLGFLAVGFLVSWFQSCLVSRLFGYSKIRRFKDSKIHFMYLKDIGSILSNYHFLFSGRYWSHIQDFQEFIRRISMAVRCPSFPKITKSRVSNNCYLQSNIFPNALFFLGLFKVSKCLQR